MRRSRSRSKSRLTDTTPDKSLVDQRGSGAPYHGESPDFAMRIHEADSIELPMRSYEVPTDEVPDLNGNDMSIINSFRRSYEDINNNENWEDEPSQDSASSQVISYFLTYVPGDHKLNDSSQIQLFLYRLQPFWS